MKKVRSKYKFFGGFGLLLGLTSMVTFGTILVLTCSNISFKKVNFTSDTKALLAYFLVIGFNLLHLILFATQNKFIIADSNGILFINPIFPFLKKKKLWTDFDYYVLVDENSRYSTHEAIWFVKDEKVTNRFSSFYYTNYQDIKGQIKTKGHGKKHFSSLAQLSAVLGLKKIKN